MRRKHMLAIVTGFFETFLFCGVIFGWPYLLGILEDLRIYNDLCKTDQQAYATSPAAPSTCPKQQSALNLAFVLATSVTKILLLPCGYIYDTYGTWATRTLATIMFVSNCILFAVINMQQSWVIYPSALLMCISGDILLMSMVQLSYLSPKRSSFIMSLIIGAYDGSAAVALVLKSVYDQGISVQAIFIAYSLLSVFSVTRTLFLTPKYRFPRNVPADIVYGIRELNCCSESPQSPENLAHLSSNPPFHLCSSECRSELRSFRQGLCTVYYWGHIYFLVLGRMLELFFISTVKQWLSALGAPAHYESAFGIMLISGIALNFVFGIIMDKMTACFTTRRAEFPMANTVCVILIVTIVIAILFCGLILINILPLQYFSFFLFSIFRAFFYNVAYAFVSTVFPSKDFGKFHGFAFTITGFVSLLQFPIFSSIVVDFKANFDKCIYVFLGMFIASLLHPFQIISEARKKKSPRNAK
uniref:Solute carrier family 43 member 3 n=1 Tax=Ciona intestinalis TaxID=7719 RepID=F6Q966_CIOIN